MPRSRKLHASEQIISWGYGLNNTKPIKLKPFYLTKIIWFIRSLSLVQFSFRPTTSSIVFTHLNRLSKTKSTGLDSISAKLIRECADIISGPLCDLFNKSFMSGIFPDDWKCARVIPLFKQGESFDLNNYLCHFSCRQSVREDCVRSVIQLLK